MKLLIVIQFICIINISLAQISPFVFKSYKDYDDDKRIAYFYINGIKSIKEQNYVQNQLIKDPDIKRFFIYEKENSFNSCMIETKSNIDEEYILILINGFIEKYNNEKEIKLFYSNKPKYIDTGDAENDRLNYDSAKQKWIDDNYELYLKLTEDKRTPEEIEYDYYIKFNSQ